MKNSHRIWMSPYFRKISEHLDESVYAIHYFWFDLKNNVSDIGA